MSTDRTMPLGEVDDAMLRAWAEAGYLPVAVYAAEMARRRKAQPEAVEGDEPAGGKPL